jgi:hypothetical protein
MIQNRSQTAPCSRNHSRTQDINTRLSSTRACQPNIANKLSPTPPLAVPRNISTPKTSGKINDRLYKRAKSAPPGSRPHHSSSILDIRGKYFEQNGKTFDMMSYLKSKSFPRRIHRLINETPNNASENKNEDNSSSPADDDAEDTLSASQIGLNNKQLLERRRGLHRKRSMNRSGVSVSKRLFGRVGCACIYIYMEISHRE